jgi:hypothetical protein
VGSTKDLGTVENAVQPLVGSSRLLDHLTIASMNSGSQVAASAPISNVSAAQHSAPLKCTRLSNVNVQVAADGASLRVC